MAKKKSAETRHRKAITVDVRQQVLHQAGYRCSIPSCRFPITLEAHHIVWASKGGPNTSDNLLALCRNCHELHHRGLIPQASILTWKQLQLALNEGFDRRVLDTLLAIGTVGPVLVSGGELLHLSPLIASGFIKSEPFHRTTENRFYVQDVKYEIALNARGLAFVTAWKSGDQSAIDAVIAPRFTTADGVLQAASL